MSDDANPYRSPAIVYVEEDWPDPPQTGDDLDRLLRLKSLERDWRHEVGAIVVHLGFLAVGLTAIWLEPHAPETSLLAAFQHLKLIAFLGGGASGLALFLGGMKLAVDTRVRWVVASALGLLLPAWNVVVAAVLVRRAIRDLADQGVRLGLLACDYSQAEVSVRIAQGQRR